MIDEKSTLDGYNSGEGELLFCMIISDEDDDDDDARSVTSDASTVASAADLMDDRTPARFHLTCGRHWWDSHCKCMAPEGGSGTDIG